MSLKKSFYMNSISINVVLFRFIILYGSYIALSYIKISITTSSGDRNATSFDCALIKRSKSVDSSVHSQRKNNEKIMRSRRDRNSIKKYNNVQYNETAKILKSWLQSTRACNKIWRLIKIFIVKKSFVVDIRYIDRKRMRS